MAKTFSPFTSAETWSVTSNASKTTAFESGLLEVAARSLLLRLKGLHPAAELEQRLQEAMANPDFVAGRFELDEGDLE